MIAIHWGGAQCVAGTWFWGGVHDYSVPSSDQRYGKPRYERRFFWQSWSPFHPFGPCVLTIGIGPLVIVRKLKNYGSRRKGGTS